MLNTVVLSAMTLFLTVIAQSEEPNWVDLLETFREYSLIDWLWIPVSLAIVAILGILGFADTLSGALSLFGIESLFRRAKPSEQTLKTSRNQLLQILKKENEMRLANSLHNLVKLDLYMEDQRQQVGQLKFELAPEDPPDFREPGFHIEVQFD